jgi:nucleobase:cation symporter-1, NCS1 family
VPSFFSSDGGIYGNYNLTAIVCYLVGITVQIPFVAADFYTGPLARAIGGIDLSWMVGIAVVSPVYYFSVRFFERPRPAAPVASVSGIR